MLRAALFPRPMSGLSAVILHVIRTTHVPPAFARPSKRPSTREFPAAPLMSMETGAVADFRGDAVDASQSLCPLSRRTLFSVGPALWRGQVNQWCETQSYPRV